MSDNSIRMATESGPTQGASSGEVSRFLSFRLDRDDYAIPLLRVKEVIALPELTPVPQTPPHFLGIMNLRGQIISVVDLRLKLNLLAENNEDTCVVICDLAPYVLGVVVSSVTNVLALTPDEIGPRPEVHGTSTEYVLGVAKLENSLVLILDLAAALGGEDQLTIQRTNSTTNNSNTGREDAA